MHFEKTVTLYWAAAVKGDSCILWVSPWQNYKHRKVYTNTVCCNRREINSLLIQQYYKVIAGLTLEDF